MLLLWLTFDTELASEYRYNAYANRAGVRCLCLLLPLMGCTWVIGLFYVNESIAWVQYVFAMCNSLQIRNALQKQKRKKHSQSFMSTNKTFVSTSFTEDSLALSYRMRDAATINETDIRIA
ncbi:hypothetical protein DPMN_102462 [Dreissena polymorpha]|uniref:G-protein coupled receptors family 2 profile 2 domain-containing protein n=1 Tax=Dreissena polymorpha TaxID=45954 RepID=A0A9D4LJD3_DREPO|nr:hypothetical protein DPMN_102462 [Dreissena polymorpha]